MTNIDKKSLLAFIVKAHKNTYAAPQEIKSKYKCKKPILEGHRDYDFVDGDFRYHDSYAGIHWAPGREVVFFKTRPVWCMSYQGKTAEGLSDDFIEKIFGFLQSAMRNIDEKIPFRGPKIFQDKKNGFEYIFIMKGDYQYFTGRESIVYKGKKVFFQDVIGGLIK
jgi:hypothetical protein